jgi:hypothetical protein
MKRMFLALRAGLTAAPLVLVAALSATVAAAPRRARRNQPAVQFYTGNFPGRDLGRYQRPHVPADRRVRVRDPALPELPESAQLPLHRAEARAAVQLDDDLPVLTLRAAR